MDAPSIRNQQNIKITDHKLIHCSIKCQKEKVGPQHISYRDFSKFDINKATEKISEINWNGVYEMQDVNEIERFITSGIKSVFDELAPVVCKRVTKKRAPWRNEAIKAMTKLKNRLRNKYWKTRDNNDWAEYKNVRNSLNREVWRAKKTYFSEKLSTCENPKEFWATLKQGGIAGDEKKIKLPPEVNVNEVNKYFSEMGHGRDIDENELKFFQTHRKDGIGNGMSFRMVTDAEVKNAMNSIKSHAVGSDTISIDMIRAVSPFALGAITHLVNVSLATGQFPQRWKTSIIHPLPKVSKPTKINHFRPISVLPAMSKILEKIVVEQINSYINSIDLLPKLQSGFRRNHSTCTALLNLFSDLFDARDEGKYSSLVMLDFAEAFDSMTPEMLVAKMKYYRFRKDVIDWVESYFRDRDQITKDGSETSEPRSKTRGAPQGSGLAPILFILFLADLVRCLQYCTLHGYADDCQLHLSFELERFISATGAINTDLINVLKWANANGLKLNIGKCSVMHLVPEEAVKALSERGVTVMLDGQSLSVVQSIKTLGVVLDNRLTFSEHVTQTIQKALGRLRGLYRYRELLPQDAKLQLVQSLILSVFYYCYPAYGNSISKGDMDRIQQFQNSAVRFVCSLRRMDHVSPYRDALQLPLMKTVCRMLTCCIVHKTLTLNEPKYLSERLQRREEVAHRGTRQNRKLHFPRVRCEQGKKSFSYFGPTLFNDLPDDLTEVTSCVTFKRRLKEFLYEG